MIVVFVNQSIPQRQVEKIYNYKGFLSEEQKEELINLIAKDVKDIDDYQITIDLNIELKKYKK